MKSIFSLKKAYLCLALLLFACAPALFAQQEMQPLPIDPNVRYGKLPNGLTYYIRHNELPKERADFYIAQNVGSILEEENQRGLAHFLEHMAFNGSKNFPENGIDTYLQSLGMRMGENLNAYTGIDETVYTIINAPVSRQTVIDSCLLILHDWSGFLALTDSMIEKERGIIREEWRTRSDASFRILEKQLADIMPTSRYAHRMPIGTLEVINNFKPDELRAYYHKWYRPDLQAIIVVGDIDVDSVEQTIHTMFADIPAPVNPAPRPYFPVEDNVEPIVSIITDKEASDIFLYLYHKYDPLSPAERASIVGLTDDYLAAVCSQMLNERLGALLHRADPPFVYAQSYNGSFMGTRTKKAFTMLAIAQEGKLDSTLNALVRETERVRRFGFTASEYERARISLLKRYESAYNERDKQQNGNYTREYVSHFTEGGYIPGIETEYRLVSQLAPQISLEQVNAYIARLIKQENLVITLEGPDKEGLSYPSKDSLLTMYRHALEQPVEPYREEVNNDPLIPHLPTPGTIVREERDSLFGATILHLSNGARVLLKHTDLKKDEILMTATSPGGNTLFGDDDDRNLQVFNSVAGLGGLGNFSAIDLSKKLAGKKVACSASLGLDNESLNGSASPADIRTLFELMYLAFTSPRADDEAYQSFETRMKAELENSQLDPSYAFNDSITRAVYGNHPRVFPLRAEDFERISYPRILEMYRDRFSDASDFTFTFVGNLDVDSIKPLVCQYLATLPTLKRKEAGRAEALPAPRKGAHEVYFTRPMETPKASVFQFYSTDMDFTLKNQMLTAVLSRVLDFVYTETIRESEGASYGVSAYASVNIFPPGKASLQIYFDTDPAKWRDMSRIVDEQLRRIAEEGPDASHFSKSVDNMLKRHTEQLQENGYWLNAIDTYYFRHIDLSSDYEETLRALTPADVQHFVSLLLDSGNRIEVVMSGTGE